MLPVLRPAGPRRSDYARQTGSICEHWLSSVSTRPRSAGVRDRFEACSVGGQWPCHPRCRSRAAGPWCVRPPGRAGRWSDCERCRLRCDPDSRQTDFAGMRPAHQALSSASRPRQRWERPDAEPFRYLRGRWRPGRRPTTVGRRAQQPVGGCNAAGVDELLSGHDVEPGTKQLVGEAAGDRKQRANPDRVDSGSDAHRAGETRSGSRHAELQHRRQGHQHWAACREVWITEIEHDQQR